MTNAPSTLDPQTTAFIDRLWRGGAFGFVQTFNGGPANDERRSEYFAAGQPIRLAPALLDSKNTFYGVNPTTIQRPHWQASHNADIAALNCLYAEFDGKLFTFPTPEEIQAQFVILRSDPDKAKVSDKALLREALDDAQDAKYATDPAHYNALALAHVQALEPAPSVIVASGGGWQCFWLLRETFIIATEADRDHAKDIQKRFVAFVGGDPAAADIRRILRLPGSHNVKKKYPTPLLVTYLKYELALEYSLESLAALLPAPTPKATPTRTQHAISQPNDATGAAQAYDGDSVIDAYNAAHKITDTLLSVGYTQHGDRLSRPGEPESKGVSIFLDSNTSFHHSSNDPLWNDEGHTRSPFNVFCTFEHDGAVKPAVAAAALELGMGWPEIDWPALRLWVRSTSFREFHTETPGAVYRTDSTDTKLADAVLDEMEHYRRPKVYTSKRRLAKLAGVSPNTALKCVTTRLHGWFCHVEVTQNGLTITLDRSFIKKFRFAHIDQLKALPVNTLFTGQSARNETNEYSPRKATDPFLTGTSPTVKEQAEAEALVAGCTHKEWLETMPKGLGESALRVLDALGRVPMGLTTSELAEETGKTKGAVWRACRRLEREGLLESSRENSRAPKVYELATDVWSKIEVLAPKLRTYKMSADREALRVIAAKLWAERAQKTADELTDFYERRVSDMDTDWSKLLLQIDAARPAPRRNRASTYEKKQLSFDEQVVISAVKEFTATCLEFQPGATEPVNNVHNAFDAWLTVNNAEYLKDEAYKGWLSHVFAKQLKAHGVKPPPMPRSGGPWLYTGLTFRAASFGDYAPIGERSHTTNALHCAA